MTDGQYFYLAIVAGLALGVLLENLWMRIRRVRAEEYEDQYWDDVDKIQRTFGP